MNNNRGINPNDPIVQQAAKLNAQAADQQRAIKASIQDTGRLIYTQIASDYLSESIKRGVIPDDGELRLRAAYARAAGAFFIEAELEGKTIKATGFADIVNQIETIRRRIEEN